MMIFSHFDSIGPYFLSSAFIPLLFASKVRAKYNNDNIQPQIINTSSMNGWTKVSSLFAFPSNSRSRFADPTLRLFRPLSRLQDPATGGHCYPYLLSKAAIAHMTSLLAHDFLPIGIRVNQIAPGWFVTGMSAPGTVDEYGVSKKQGEFPFLPFVELRSEN